MMRIIILIMTIVLLGLILLLFNLTSQSELYYDITRLNIVIFLINIVFVVIMIIPKFSTFYVTKIEFKITNILYFLSRIFFAFLIFK